MTIDVNNLLNIPLKKITSITQRYNVILDDKYTIKKINPSELHVSLYIWSILKRYDTPITKELQLNNFYVNGYYSKSTLNKILSVIKERIIEDTLIPKYKDGDKIRVIIDQLHKDMLITTNDIYNNLIFSKLEYMSSLDIKDFLEIQNNKELMEVMREVEKYKGNAYIKKAYDVINNLMFSDVYKHNPIARGYRAGLLNKNQVVKVFGPGGFITELNNKIFKTPITSSFTMGLKDMYEISAESRTAAKALSMTNKAIADSEAFARLLQLTTMVVYGITVTDCGNDEYETYYVSPATDTYKGDLEGLNGKYRFDKELGKEVVIRKSDKHLIGTNILLRTVMNCKLPNKYNVCSQCFGKLTWSIPTHYNIGHLTATVLTQVLTQSLLSLKHLVVSASSRGVTLPPKIAKYFNIKGNNFFIKPTLLNRDSNITIHIAQEEAIGFMILVNKIKNITYKIENLENTIQSNKISGIDTSVLERELNIIKVINEETIDSDKGKISWINNMVIKHVVNDKHYSTPFNIKKVTKNIGHLSINFLIWVITNNKYTLDDDGNYVINLQGYTLKKPIMELPDKEYDFTQLIDEVKKLVRSSDTDRDTSYGPSTLLDKLYQTVNEKVNTNIAILEIIVYALTVPDNTGGNYDLSRNSSTKRLASLSNVSKHRSFTLGGNDTRRLIFSQAPFGDTNKPHSPADILLKPNEVLKDIEDGTRVTNHK